MWKMFDDMIECDECGSPLGPPPKFMIPPPPRPPSMGEYNPSNCNEEEMALKAQLAWDSDMCEAIPILDASLYSSQSLQTSAMIAVFSLLLVLVVLISSLFVWKNKRKVQNFLPCKTPTRGPHINGGLPIGSGHSVTYEDPDAHLGHHRPLVMRHHHNVEMLHGKGIHYPSGYPMTRSPPFLVSSSPGPDPYRSNDNVYEELGPGRDSDGESEPPLHSDDDFAEDELSLPGERSFNKTNVSETPSTLPAVSTIYHERVTAAATSSSACAAVALPSNASNAAALERNSVLSSSSSTQDASTATAVSSSSSHNNNSANLAAAAPVVPIATRSGPSGLLTGMLRHTTGRSKFHTNGRKNVTASNVDDFNTSTSTTDDGNMRPIQQLYDQRSNLMSLAYVPQHQQQQQQQHVLPPHAAAAAAYHHSLHHIGSQHQHPHQQQQQHHNHNFNIISNNNARSTAHQFYNTLETEVERRNRINAQLSHAPHAPPPAAVATIFRERIHYPGSGRYPQPYYASQNSVGGLIAASASMRSRTNPRSMERRHRIAAPADPIEPAYGYAEPVYHENYHYDTCGGAATPPTTLQQRFPAGVYPSAAFVMPNGYRTQPLMHHNAHNLGSATYQNNTLLYGRGGDSSFGSDSGYSHHTPASSIGRHDYDVAAPITTTTTPITPKSTSKLSAALSFGWNRRKSTPSTPTTLAVSSAGVGGTSALSCSAEATSPNNNSGSSTVTSSLENSSSASSTSASGCMETSAAAAAIASATAQNNNAQTQQA